MYYYKHNDIITNITLCIHKLRNAQSLNYGPSLSPLLKKDNLHIKDKMPAPDLSVIRRFHCIIYDIIISLSLIRQHFLQPTAIRYVVNYTEQESLNEYRHQLVYYNVYNGVSKETLGEIVIHPGSSYDDMKSIFDIVVSTLLSYEQ